MVESGTVLKRRETSLCCPNCKKYMLYWDIISMDDGVASHFYCDKCKNIYFDTDLIENNVIEYGEDINDFIYFDEDNWEPHVVQDYPDDIY